MLVSLSLCVLLQNWYFYSHLNSVLLVCGVLQESVLCVAMFPVAVSGTVSNIRLSVVTSWYVASITIFYSFYVIKWASRRLLYMVSHVNCGKRIFLVCSKVTMYTFRTVTRFAYCPCMILNNNELLFEFFIQYTYRPTVAELNHITSITVHRKRNSFPHNLFHRVKKCIKLKFLALTKYVFYAIRHSIPVRHNCVLLYLYTNRDELC
jgi:hypothetical protein